MHAHHKVFACRTAWGYAEEVNNTKIYIFLSATCMHEGEREKKREGWRREKEGSKRVERKLAEQVYCMQIGGTVDVARARLHAGENLDLGITRPCASSAGKHLGRQELRWVSSVQLASAGWECHCWNSLTPPHHVAPHV